MAHNYINVEAIVVSDNSLLFFSVNLIKLSKKLSMVSSVVSGIFDSIFKTSKNSYFTKYF